MDEQRSPKYDLLSPSTLPPHLQLELTRSVSYLQENIGASFCSENHSKEQWLLTLLATFKSFSEVVLLGAPHLRGEQSYFCFLAQTSYESDSERMSGCGEARAKTSETRAAVS